MRDTEAVPPPGTIGGSAEYQLDRLSTRARETHVA
jgi:hypothetical protein